MFCKIIAGHIPAEKIYEDENVLAFLDIHPTSKGHSLVIHKKHSENLIESDDEMLAQLLPQIKKVAGAIEHALNSDGFNVTMAKGETAGQTVFHLHFHIIPRYRNDGLKPWPHGDSEPKTREEIAAHIKKFFV